MRIFFIIFVWIIFLTDVAVVLDATGQPKTNQNVDGVRIERQATSATNYSYFVFTNSNNHPVVVNYVVTGHIPCDITLQEGESRRSHTAYANSSDIKMSVTKATEDSAKREKKKRKKRLQIS